MSTQTKHPTEGELTAFSLGQLPPDAALAVEQHVSDCDSCCETIVDLTSDDTFVGLLQEVKASSQQGSDTVLHQTLPSIPTPLRDHARYQIEEIVGRGGMGQVYKARHRMMDRTVALKVIHSEWVQKQEAIDRFRREVKTAASLDHRNIVTAHDAEQAGELHFLAMEFVDGVDLAKTVQNRGPLPVDEACDYIRQAAIGLEYAHQRGMVHRDIKPHNLMVTQNKVIKILDFGLASLAPQSTPGESISDDATGNLTMAGAIMGTPDFISPEQAQDARGVDGRSDIYSLGMTLYYLLAGKVPFSEGTAISKLKLHAESNPTPLNELRDDLPAEVLDILAKMIAKDPAERFQSPAEIVDALEPFVITTLDASDSGGKTSEHSVKSRGWGWWPLVAVASAAVLLLGGFSMVANGFFGFGAVPMAPDEVHASLDELDSYVVSMMNSPHDLVFMNLHDIGPNRNYLTFKAIEGGVDMRLPAFPAHAFDKRQSGYVRKLKRIAAELSLTTKDESEVRNGKIDGVTVIVEVKGEAKDVADTIQQIVQRTFEVQETEECEFTFRNLPSEASAKIGNGPKQVSAEEFVAEHARGKRVYFGENQNLIFLVPAARKAEKQFQRNAEVWYTNINGLPDGFASTIRVGGEVQDASNEVALTAEDLVARFEGAHENEVALIVSAVCKAAGIPNEQWQAAAKSPTGSMKSISGEPLSLVLLSNRFFSDALTQSNFRYLGERIPKPSELSGAMALSMASGYYSILQPQYITDLTYEVEAAESNTAKLSGRVHFNGLGMYAGLVQFVASVDSDLSIAVSEFTLPAHGITIQRDNESELWAESEISGSSLKAFDDDYDLSLVPARATEIYGFCPSRLANKDHFGQLLDKLADSTLPIAMSLDRSLEQVVWTKLPEETGLRDAMIGILTVADGTSLEFAEQALGPNLFADYDGEASWQELSKQDPLSFDKNRCFQIVGNKTLLIGTWQALECYKELAQQPRELEYLAATSRLNKKDYQVFAVAKSMDQKYLKKLTGETTNFRQLSLLLKHLPIVTDSEYFGLTLSLEFDPRLELFSRYRSPAEQAGVSKAMRGLAESLAELVGSFPVSSERTSEDGAPQLTTIVKTSATTALKEAKLEEPSDQVSRLTVSLSEIEPQVQPYIQEMLGKLASRRALYDLASRNNLQQIAQAFMLFEADHGYLPSTKTKIPGAKFPISWRVAILPYLGYEELYKSYSLEHEWDSRINAGFLDSMPEIYRHRSQDRNLGTTNYVTVSGQGSVTGDGEKQFKLDELRDDPITTILVSEVIAQIPWTSPEDVVLDPAKSLPKLGGSYPDAWQVAMADGSVQRIPSDTSDATLRAMMTRDGGEVVEKNKGKFELR